MYACRPDCICSKFNRTGQQIYCDSNGTFCCIVCSTSSMSIACGMLCVYLFTNWALVLLYVYGVTFELDKSGWDGGRGGWAGGSLAQHFCRIAVVAYSLGCTHISILRACHFVLRNAMNNTHTHTLRNYSTTTTTHTHSLTINPPTSRHYPIVPLTHISECAITIKLFKWSHTSLEGSLSLSILF